jgi:thiol-disulfide isomerase/thioredoxin
MNMKLFTTIITALLLISSLSSHAQIAIGKKAPEMAFTTPTGDTLKLSSLKGKVVLLDFWASWCGPCRRQSPNLVQLYKEYETKKWMKGTKGFAIYSYSLDRDKASWENAIKADNLYWKTHASDLMFWGGAGAKVYGVNSIPRTYLIDEGGFIIAINPSYELIKSELNKRLAK